MNDVLRYKLLSGNLEQGPHTMILQSDPRAAQTRRGQYHPADEEFYCLGGDFTFDGATWFCEGSYAFYPAFMVHGTRVHVRGGYEVYLRISGTNEIFWEDNPMSDKPYAVQGAVVDGLALQLKSWRASNGAETDLGAGLSAQQLNIDAKGGGGSMMVTVKAGVTFSVGCSHLLEIFTLAGIFRTPDNQRLQAKSYLCDAAPENIQHLICAADGRLLISHGGLCHLSLA